MAPTIEFTLEELAKIALGAPELTNLNIHVLHNLINIIFKKIDCQDDEITISGLEAQCLDKLMQKSKPPPFEFDDSKVDLLKPKLQRLHNLEDNIQKTQNKLDNHIRLAEKFNKPPEAKLEIKDLEYMQRSTKDRCFPCEEERQIACYLANDFDFLKKLQRRLSAPMIMSLFDLEKRISDLNDDMNEFIAKSSQHLEKIALIDACLEQMQVLRSEVDDEKLKFLGTMEEVQDILDIKLDKLQIPALKKFIETILLKMDGYVEELQKDTNCPKPPGIVVEGLRCLSCGDRKICMEKGVHATGVLPDAKPYKPKKLVLPCWSGQEPLSLHQTVNTTILSADIVPDIRKKTQQTKESDCRLSDHFDVLEGTNGTMYRKG